MPSVQLELEELCLGADELESGEAVVGIDARAIAVRSCQFRLDLFLKCAKGCGKPFRALLLGITEEELAGIGEVSLGLPFAHPPFFRRILTDPISGGTAYQEAVNLVDTGECFVL
jgi:hypothetical protein